MKDCVRYIASELIFILLKNKYVINCAYLIQYSLLRAMKLHSYILYKVYLKNARTLSLVANKNIDNLENIFLCILRGKYLSDKYCLLNMFLNTSSSRNTYNEFKQYGVEYQSRIKFPRSNDFHKRQGDLVILKPYISNSEKGVLLIQYNDSINRFAAIYDLPNLAKYYRIILEPSTWGYQYIEILNYLNLDTDVIVESQRKEDFDYITKIGFNLIPIRIGAGDWVDPTLFKKKVNDNEVTYDLIMIASWQCMKRHDLLFRELSKIDDKISKIALVGYPIAGRTKYDIIANYNKRNLRCAVDVYDDIANDKVAELLRKSKCSVMLSRREGANKAVYESIFSDVPVIVSQCNVGINRDHINNNTGIFAKDEELHGAILYMKDNCHKFSAREWALNNTGCFNAFNKTNNLLKKLSYDKGEDWTMDIFKRKGGGKHIKFNDDVYYLIDAEFKKIENFINPIILYK